MFITRDDCKISIAGGLLVVGLTLAAGFTVYSMLKPLIESSLSKGIGVALKGKADFLESQIEEAKGMLLSEMNFDLDKFLELYSSHMKFRHSGTTDDLEIIG